MSRNINKLTFLFVKAAILTLFSAGGGVRSDPPPVFELWQKSYLSDQNKKFFTIFFSKILGVDTYFSTVGAVLENFSGGKIAI